METCVGNTTVKPIPSRPTDLIGQASLVGQGRKKPNEICSPAKAQAHALLAKINPEKFRALHSQNGGRTSDSNAY